MRRAICVLAVLGGCVGETAPEVDSDSSIHNEEDIGSVTQDLDSSCGAGSWFGDQEDLAYSAYKGHRFQAPMTAFGGDFFQASSFLVGLEPRVHLSLPFGTEHHVKLGSGWRYDSGGSHRGLDYSRDDVDSGADPTFSVRAMADGIVRAVVPMTKGSSGGGNTVIIEHTGSDGSTMLTLYMHLRNGKTHDWNVVMNSDTEEQCEKYYLWAKNNPNHKTWGTEYQTIAVAVGDRVKRGQHIAWAGNTGCGGIRNGLNDDGSPKDSTKVNTHLHVYVTYEAPGLTATNSDGSTAKVAVQVDPYGIYDEEDSGCYSALRETTYKRLLQPFHPDFHHVKYEDFKYFWNYYPNVGYSPATLSIARDGGDVFASGSFQRNLGTTWKTLFWYKGSDFDAKVDDYAAQGLRPRQTQVALASDGTPRYTAIFRPAGAADYDYGHLLPEPTFVAMDAQLVVNGNYRVDDFFSYQFAIPSHAALFTEENGVPSKLMRNLSNLALQPTIGTQASLGWLPVNASVNDWGSFDTNVIFKQDPSCWSLHKGMSSAGYQSVYDTMVGKGYRLAKLQSYNDAQSYMAIFTRAPSGGTCP